jgi:hypothetical protein
MHILYRKYILLICLFLLLPVQNLAQSSGSTSASITGKIRDSQGSAIDGAKVVAKEIKTNFSREVLASFDGVFLLNQLPPGQYEIKIEAEGFSTKLIEFELILGTTSLLNVDLKVVEVADSVEVTDSLGVRIVGQTERATNINSTLINELPINRRNFLDFTLTTAGVTPNRVPADGPSATSGLAFHGQSARGNNITIDGLDNNEFAAGRVRTTFSQEAVQEFQVIGANYSAEFGRAIGGVVNIVTKGGSNEFHTSIFNFIRTDEISARDTFSKIKPDFQQYQFGSSLSGAIKKDLYFYFLSFERLSVKQNSIVTINDQVIKSARSQGFNISNGAIPFSRGITSLLGRGDFQLSLNNRLTTKYTFGGEYDGALQPFGGLFTDTSAGILKLTDNSFTLNNTFVNSSLNLINETRFLYTRRKQKVLPIDNFGPAVNLFTDDGQITFGRDPLLPQGTLSNSYQFVNILSLNRSNHQIKTGFDFLLSHSPKDAVSLPILFGGFAVFAPVDFSVMAGIPGLPKFTALELFDPKVRSPQQQSFLTLLSSALPNMFPGFPSGLPLKDLSIPLAYLQGFGNPRLSGSYKYFSAFFQDDLQLKPNLLIKLGIRYDLERIGFAPTNKGNFSPRIGFNYRPKDNERLTFAASYGIFHGTSPFGVVGSTRVLETKSVVTPVFPFPFSIIPFSLPGHRFSDESTLPTGVNLIPQLAREAVIDKNLRNSYTQQANFTLNYSLSQNTSISFIYQHIRGLKLFIARNINPIVRPNPRDPVSSAVLGRIDTNRGEVINFESSGDSYYNGATIQLFSKLGKNFTLLAHYTRAKTIDNFVDIRVDILSQQNPLNLTEERALSLQDVRDRFVLSNTWQPTGTKILKGFSFSSIITLSSGTPFNLLTGVDMDGNGDNPPADRPNRIGRNLGQSPGFASVSFRTSKSIKINEKIALTAYLEAFNLFNRVNIDRVRNVFSPNPDGTFQLPPQENGRFIATPDRFASAFAPRQFQFGFRISY